MNVFPSCGRIFPIAGQNRVDMNQPLLLRPRAVRWNTKSSRAGPAGKALLDLDQQRRR